MQQYNKQQYIDVQKDRVKKAMETIVHIFQTEDIVKEFANSYVQSSNLNCDTWSFSNRMLMKYNGRTSHAGTFNYWKQNGRSVMKGQKAFYIIQPNPYTVKEKDKETGEEKEKTIMFYNAVAEFGYNQTEGKQMNHVVVPKQLPPLMDIITQKLGIEVTYDRTFKGENGYTDTKKIVLCDYEPNTLYHELIHIIDQRLHKDLKSGQHKEQEIIAELGACVIAKIYGIDTINKSYTYIESYLTEGYTKKVSKEDIGKYCVKILKRLEDILNYIFEKAESK